MTSKSARLFGSGDFAPPEFAGAVKLTCASNATRMTGKLEILYRVRNTARTMEHSVSCSRNMKLIYLF